jgi:hypothetical protein
MQRGFIVKTRLIVGVIVITSVIAAVALVAPLVSSLVAPQSASAAPDTSGSVSISLDFRWIRQGQVGIVRVSGARITEVRGIFQERVFYFYPENGNWVGMLSADIEYLVGDYPLQVWVKYEDGSTEMLEQPVDVEDGQFGRSTITLNASLYPLLEPEVEANEMARLFNILDRFTPLRYWAEKGFVRPLDGVEIGWFGTYRLYNNTYWRRHTGIDVRAAMGTPIQAMGDGRVIFAEEFDIRGGYVLIDHGWGVYSGYAHLSEKLVVPGQWVRQGDVIALSGKNGRSNGAHLHYEMSVGGAWTDPAEFMALINGDGE